LLLFIFCFIFLVWVHYIFSIPPTQRQTPSSPRADQTKPARMLSSYTMWQNEQRPSFLVGNNCQAVQPPTLSGGLTRTQTSTGDKNSIWFRPRTPARPQLSRQRSAQQDFFAATAETGLKQQQSMWLKSVGGFLLPFFLSPSQNKQEKGAGRPAGPHTAAWCIQSRLVCR